MQHLKTLLALAAVAWMPVAAQPTISSSNMPVAGQSVTYYSVDIDPLLTTGVLQTWDLSGPASYNQTISFLAPAGQPGSADYPTATAMSISDGDPGSYEYIRTSPTAFEGLGNYDANDDISYIAVDPFKILTLPCTYGTNWTDTYHLVGGLTDEMNDWSFEADGWGTLVGNGGSWNDVLKVHGTTTTMDTMVLGVHYEQFYSLDIFWRAGEVFYVATATRLEMFIDGVSQWVDGNVQMNADLAIGIGEHANDPSLLVSPNPASDLVLVTTTMTDAGTIVLVDMTGREVLRTAITGAHHQLDVGTLSPGQYMVRAVSRSGAFTSSKLMIE